MADEKRPSSSLIQQEPPATDTAEWNICCSKSDSAAVKYFVQVGMAGVVMSFSMYCICVANETEDKAIYWSLLSSTLTFFLDAPSIDSKSSK